MILGRYFIVTFLILLNACTSSHITLTPLPPDATILAFGDSLTFGTGAPPGASYPEQLAELTGLKVINDGVPGEETSQAVVRIKESLAKYQPHLVIVCVGGNDFILKKPFAEIQSNLKAIITTIKASGAQAIIIAVPRLNLGLGVPEFYEVVGHEMQVPVEHEALPKFLGDTSYKADYVHLNANGYHEFAKHIATFLKNRGAISYISQ